MMDLISNTWLSAFFIILVVGFIFYRIGLTDNENKKVFFMPIIFILIGLGLFFSYKKYAALFGWSSTLKLNFTPEEFSSYVGMPEKKFIQHLYELGINHSDVIEYYDHAPDHLEINSHDIGDSNKGITAIEYNFSLSSGNSDFKIAYISCFISHSKVNRCYWQFTKKNLYEQALNKLKKYNIIVENDESVDYQIGNNLVISDLGFDIVSKTYVLNARNEGAEISINNKLN